MSDYNDGGGMDSSIDSGTGGGGGIQKGATGDKTLTAFWAEMTKTVAPPPDSLALGIKPQSNSVLIAAFVVLAVVLLGVFSIILKKDK